MNAVITIFGATGDLVAKKIAPALYLLYKNMPKENHFKIIGFSRRNYDVAGYQNHVKEILNKFETSEAEKISEFLNNISFVRSDFADVKGYQSLQSEIASHSQKDPVYVFYLAVQPEFYESIITNLKPIVELIQNKKNIRLVVEKPIGTSQDTAMILDKTLKSIVSEEQIFRIDHYLHKPSVRNIFAMRFSNSLIAPAWNNDYIEKIELTTNEIAGVEDRGEYYDSTGALIDVGQNHLLSVLALLTMDKPEHFNGSEIQQSRANLLSQISPINVSKSTFRSQYNGYQNIDGVKNKSNVETYFKMRLSINNKRWKGVPVVVSGGKGLEKEDKKAVVWFKKGTCSKALQSMRKVVDIPNTLTFNLSKDSIVELNLDLFSNDRSYYGCQIFHHDKNVQYVGEYMNAFEDIILGEKTWFLSYEETLAAWKLIDPVITGWKNNETPLYSYNKNSTEPLMQSKYIEQLFPNDSNQVGIIGLGKMGMGVALQLLEKGWDVLAWNRSEDKRNIFAKAGGKVFETIQQLTENLDPERKILLFLPAGEVLNQTIWDNNGLSKILSKGDIIIDSGNSKYSDSIANFQKLKALGINFIDSGISGGPTGARNGACLMIGGENQIFQKVERLFFDIALPGAYKFFDQPGAGHFVKMIHNAIEYGMMQSIAEGFELLNKSPFNFNLSDISDIYSKGSVISSRLVDWLHESFVELGIDLSNVSGKVGLSGEAEWALDFAKSVGITSKVIADSVNFRNSSSQEDFKGKILTALRNRFGGHSII